jgi:hypothetical protein
MIISVSSILYDKYGILTKPGQQINCPFCHRDTFSIKGDHSIGKCFHSDCYKNITRFLPENSQDNLFYKLLDDIYRDFFNELMLMKNTKRVKNAYIYLVEEGKIHSNVVQNSMMGVFPKKYDLQTKFELLFSQIKLNFKAVPKKDSKEYDGSGK